MFSFKKTVVTVAALSMLVGFGACKKSDSANGGDATALAALASSGSWDKSEVNVLFGLVPDDSSIVYASTRNLDVNKMQSMFKGMTKWFGQYDNLIDKALAETTDEAQIKAIKESKEMLNSMKLISTDFKAYAKAWGIDENGHADAIMYMNKDALVAHVTVADSSILKSKLNGYVELLKTVASKEDLTLDSKTIGEGDDAWIMLSSPAENDKELPGFAFHFGNKIVSVAIINSNADAAKLASFLKPAAKSVKKGDFGKIGDDVVGVGYMDNLRMMDYLDSALVQKILKEIDVEIPGGCVKDVKDIISNMKRTNFSASIKSDGTLAGVSTIVLSDKAELAKLNDLHTASPDVMKDKSLVGVKVNMNIDKALTYLLDLGDRLGKKGYTCSAFTDLTSTAKELSSQITPQVRDMVAGFSGVNVALHSLDLDTKKFDAVVDVTGSGVGKTVPGILSLLQMAQPEIMSMLDLQKDKASTIDLSAMAGMPISVGMTYTDTDLVVATAGNDVLAIAKGAKSNRRNFFEIAYSMALTKLTDPTMDFGDGIMMIAAGSNDEGITITTELKF